MKKKLPVALFIGRFQPFHKGHLHAIRWIAARSSKVIVAIGSAQFSHTPENPFSLKERMRMVKRQLSAAGLLKKCVLRSVTDINDNTEWVAHLEAHVPKYDLFYSNNPLVTRLMKLGGRKVRKVPFLKMRTFNATKIREKMKGGKGWHKRVPHHVKKELKRIRGEERVRKL